MQVIDTEDIVPSDLPKEGEPPELVDAPDLDDEGEDSDENDEPEHGVASRTRKQTGTITKAPKIYNGIC